MLGFIDGHLHITANLLPHLADVRCIANADSPEEFRFLQEAGLPGMAISAGIHPWKAGESSWTAMEPCLRAADAIGEIGLDSVWCNASMDAQRAVFRRQLELACELGKPVILHTKGMEKEILESIRAYPNRYLVHWYSCEFWLDDYIELGCWFTVGPAVGADSTVKALAQRVPANKLLIESDGLEGISWAQGASLAAADYATAMRRHLEAVAELRHTSPEELAQTMAENLERFLRG